jgi:D-beta-D-heptose 7-phosphate kinase/D-beta-D-heptose 1-phosphate adenosyltransferase
MVSGGFSIIHIGHVRLIQSASEFGDVIVALNSDEWLARKKGSPQVLWEERAEVLLALRHVSKVVPVEDSDGTVCEALEKIRPMYFANGGDRTEYDQREHAVCERLGVYELFGIGGGKLRSSREFIR